MFIIKVCGIIGISKIDSCNFSDVERVKQNQKKKKKKNHSKSLKLVSQALFK